MISGTIARETNESNSTLGFGIFYWSINLGAFLFPLILVPYIKNTFGWHYVMVASAIATAAMLIPTFLIYKEPKKPENTKSLPEVFKGMIMVLTDVKFIGLIVIYSGFWILYFQMFDSVLWYVQKYVDATSLNSGVNGFLGTFGINLNWKFDVEHVTVINAGTIILSANHRLKYCKAYKSTSYDDRRYFYGNNWNGYSCYFHRHLGFYYRYHCLFNW